VNSIPAGRRFFLLASSVVMAGALSAGLLACEDTGKVSAQKATAHMTYIAQAVRADVKEIRTGMPAGAKALEELFQNAAPEVPGPVDAR
jgi:hypothetical protein